MRKAKTIICPPDEELPDQENESLQNDLGKNVKNKFA